ncbi:zinc-dependent peptidase [Sulfuriflexus mobilis]|uniref:M90 family metallopeptidase n=1 Tax=Sulfuriflexus mobilis TaxID=1811807 RepID=UPI000F81C45C|nr:M90 family metallopeptidase [Sulfuriflexus mobilis]
MPAWPLAIVTLIILVWFASRWLRARKRRALLATPLPGDWLSILKRNFPLYALLPAALQKQLHGHIQVFLHDKQFVGCAGLEVTDEIRLTIAAQACMLLLNRETDYYPLLSTILVYPDTYVAEEIISDGLVVTRQKKARLGESWRRGPVVLSWGDVRQGASDQGDGDNVVLHEFAHQLDQENPQSDGAPLLARRSQYTAWARVLSREYAELQRLVEHHQKSLINSYGATNPAEFFAVVTETFFEQPLILKKEKPALYEELRVFYKIDPADWYS